MPKQNDLPSPVTYGQKFYAKAAGMDVDLPEAITPEQKYLKAIAEGGGGASDAYTKTETDALLDTKADKTATGDNTDLTTISKTTLVAAINEVNATIGDINTVLEEVL